MERYEIPPSLQPKALALHYQKHSARQIYKACYPGEGAPVRLDAFTQALFRLVHATKRHVDELARREGIPSSDEVAAAHGDVDKIAELALMPGVLETPLDPGDEEAVAALDTMRQILLIETKKCMDEPLPDVIGDKVTMTGDLATDVPLYQGFADPRAVRAGAITSLANALAANVSTRAKFAELRLKKTVTLHNLRLASKEEAEAAEREAKKADKSAAVAPETGPRVRGGFVLNIPKPSS